MDIEIIELIREIERKNKQADEAKKEAYNNNIPLQQRKENGRSESFSKPCKLFDDTSWIEVLGNVTLKNIFIIDINVD